MCTSTVMGQPSTPSRVADGTIASTGASSWLRLRGGPLRRRPARGAAENLPMACDGTSFRGPRGSGHRSLGSAANIRSECGFRMFGMAASCLGFEELRAAMRAYSTRFDPARCRAPTRQRRWARRRHRTHGGRRQGPGRRPRRRSHAVESRRLPLGRRGVGAAHRDQRRRGPARRWRWGAACRATRSGRRRPPGSALDRAGLGHLRRCRGRPDGGERLVDAATSGRLVGRVEKSVRRGQGQRPPISKPDVRPSTAAAISAGGQMPTASGT